MAGPAPLRADDGRVRARYWLETGDDPRRAADVIAGEQSSGTFTAVPGETPALKARSGARVERVDVIDHSDRPCLPGGMAAARYTRCLVELSWPFENFGPSLPNLLATIAGNLFELRQVSGLRLLDLALPRAFTDACPGPAFGIEGTRRLSGVAHGPLIGTIVKPSVGLSPQQTARTVRELLAGGDAPAQEAVATLYAHLAADPAALPVCFYSLLLILLLLFR
jgi:ribulose-bisphosphate carboxylase large chain